MAQSAISADAQKNVTWNFNVNLIDVIFITFAFSLISRETVMPVLVSTLTDSKLAIGLIPAIWALGYYLPQLLTASFTERLRFKKPFVMLVGSVGERFPYLFIAVAIWAFALTMPTLTLTLFLFFIGMAAFSAGIATPAWFDMIAKVIPVQRRGIWSGIGHGVGALLGFLVGAYVVAQVLEKVAYPSNFALLFALAFVFVMISWVGLSLTREPPSETVKEAVPLSHYLRQLPDVLRRDHNYSRFLLSRSTMQLGAMAAGFYMVFGTERFAIGGAGVGLFTGVLIASVAIMNLVWGLIGDRMGHKLVLTGAAFCMAAAALVALLSTSQQGLLVAFVLMGAYLAADQVSALNIILEFCQPEDRPTYIGLTNTLLAPVLILSPIIGGWLATVAGYNGLFVATLIISVIGGLMMAFWVNEPRYEATAEE
jgi:MFS family permease